MKIKILVPLPSYGFDTTEVAIPFLFFIKNKFEVTFATPGGKEAVTDQRMLLGTDLGIFKKILKARKDAVEAYSRMVEYDCFKNPIRYKNINVDDYDVLYLPGGHDKGIKEYLESEILQTVVANFFELNKTVGAICHGVVLAARSINKETKKSVLHSYKVTALLKQQEMLAYNMTKYKLGDYYLTYPTLTVEEEVKSVLSSRENFLLGSKPVFRDSEQKTKRGFSVVDSNLITARWPGDIYNFSTNFIELINKYTI